MAINPFRPRRIRIIEAGWENFSGDFGSTVFEGSVSVDQVPWLEQQRLGGMLRVESAETDEDDSQIGATAELVRIRDVQAEGELFDNIDRTVLVGGEARMVASTFTRAELEEIADKDGLAGLRSIGESLGVKGRAISDLINAILVAENRPGEVVALTAEAEA